MFVLLASIARKSTLALTPAQVKTRRTHDNNARIQPPHHGPDGLPLRRRGLRGLQSRNVQVPRQQQVANLRRGGILGDHCQMQLQLLLYRW